MKRLIVLLLAACLMAGCGNQPPATASSGAAASQAVDAPTAPSTVAPAEPAATPKESIPLPDEWVGKYQSPTGDKLNIDSPTEVFYGGEQLIIEHLSTFAFGHNQAGHYVQLKYSSEKNDKQQTVHTIQIVVSDVTQNPPVTLVEYVNYTRLEGDPVEVVSSAPSSSVEPSTPPVSEAPVLHPLQGTYTGSYTYRGAVEDYQLSVSLGITVQKGELYARYVEEGEGYGMNAPYDRPPSLGAASDITGDTLNFVGVKLVNGQYGPSDQPFADISVTFSGDTAQLSITHHADNVPYHITLTRSN